MLIQRTISDVVYGGCIMRGKLSEKQTIIKRHILCIQCNQVQADGTRVLLTLSHVASIS